MGHTKLLARIGAVILAVGMLAGYLWMTKEQSQPPGSKTDQPTSSIAQPGGSEKLPFRPAFDPSITSKSSAPLIRVPPPEKLTITVEPPGSLPVTSKSGGVFHGAVDVVPDVSGNDTTAVNPLPSPTPQLNAPPNP